MQSTVTLEPTSGMGSVHAYAVAALHSPSQCVAVGDASVQGCICDDNGAAGCQGCNVIAARCHTGLVAYHVAALAAVLAQLLQGSTDEEADARRS